MPDLIGKKIVITHADHPYYAIGDIALISHKDVGGDYWAIFNNMGNKKVEGNGHWCIGRPFYAFELCIERWKETKVKLTLLQRISLYFRNYFK